MSKKFLAAIVFTFIFFVFPTTIFARSGCCSHHGGVCGCGCCDGTSLSTTCAPYYPSCSQPVYTAPARTTAPVVTYKPVYTAIPTVKPTIHPTNTPTSTATPIIPTLNPTASPEAKGAATEVSPSPVPTPTATPAPDTFSNVSNIIGWSIFAGVVAFVIRIFVKKEKVENLPEN